LKIVIFLFAFLPVGEFSLDKWLKDHASAGGSDGTPKKSKTLPFQTLKI